MPAIKPWRNVFIIGLYHVLKRFSNLLLQHAVKYEDEHALERVEDGEEIRHYDCALVDIHEAERPSQTQ